MKKIFIVLFLFIAVLGFSQDQYRSYNGEDWFEWSPDQRTAFVEGFYAAFAAVYDSNLEKGIEDNYFQFRLPTNTLMQRINQFYTGPSHAREVSIIEVILIVGEKN